MKKFFTVLGVIFLVLIVLGGVGFVLVARWGNALDKESKAYADTAIPAIVGTWSEKEVFDRASPEFKQTVTPAQVYQGLRQFSALGHLQSCDPARGQSMTSVNPQTGLIIKAEYAANARFEKGQVVFDLVLIKHGDQWQILNFFVKSPTPQSR